MREIIFLTGGTGFLGAYLLRKLLHYRNHTIEKIIVLARGHTRKEAQRRVQQGLWGHLPLRQKRGIISLLEVVRGDISKEKLGLTGDVYQRLSKEVTSIYHSAALCEFNLPLTVIRKINVQGTKTVLDFGLNCQNQGNFSCFHHISTVAVAGTSTGVFYENDLDLGQRFNNTYEQGKFEAEKLAQNYRNKGLPVTIYRPGIITGDSKTGYTSNFKMFYQPLHLFSLNLFREIPADENSCYSLCPVDYTVEAITRISLKNPSQKNMTYHIVNPHQMYLGFFLDIASKYFGFTKPRLIPREKFDFRKFRPLQNWLLKAFIPYFNYKLHFDARNADIVLGRSKINWPKPEKTLLNRLFNFCVHSGFIKKKTSYQPRRLVGLPTYEVGKRKGSVLMITLWILALLVIFALSLSQRTLFNLKLVRYQRDGLTAYYLAKSAVNKAIAVLEKDDNNYDGPDESWSTDYPYISDEQARININWVDNVDNNEARQILLELFEFAEIENPKGFRDLVVDWIDTDVEAEPGQEIFKNQPLKVPEELLLILEYYYEKSGEDKANAYRRAQEAYEKMKDLITVYPENGNKSININTASEEVLRIISLAILETSSIESLIQAFRSFRLGNNYFKNAKINTEEIKKRLELGDILEDNRTKIIDKLVSAGILSAVSTNFRIAGTGTAGNITKKITAIYDRGSNEIVYWHEK